MVYFCCCLVFFVLRDCLLVFRICLLLCGVGALDLGCAVDGCMFLQV